MINVQVLFVQLYLLSCHPTSVFISLLANQDKYKITFVLAQNKNLTTLKIMILQQEQNRNPRRLLKDLIVLQEPTVLIFCFGVRRTFRLSKMLIIIGAGVLIKIAMNKLAVRNIQREASTATRAHDDLGDRVTRGAGRWGILLAPADRQRQSARAPRPASPHPRASPTRNRCTVIYASGV